MTARRFRRNVPRGAPVSLGGDLPRARTCEHPDCQDLGQYPAPRSREALRSWRWFCLKHVREYNRSWNYFAGCDEVQIGREVRADIGWQRPTWPLGQNVGMVHAGVADLLGLLERAGRNGTCAESPARPAPSPQVVRALREFGLDADASLDTVKARYKMLVKSHHPDANGGDAHASEKLVRINAAYAVLTRHCTEA